jgi:hypothetical protein
MNIDVTKIKASLFNNVTYTVMRYFLCIVAQPEDGLTEPKHVAACGF